MFSTCLMKYFIHSKWPVRFQWHFFILFANANSTIRSTFSRVDFLQAYGQANGSTKIQTTITYSFYVTANVIPFIAYCVYQVNEFRIFILFIQHDFAYLLNCTHQAITKSKRKGIVYHFLLAKNRPISNQVTNLIFYEQLNIVPQAL